MNVINYFFVDVIFSGVNLGFTLLKGMCMKLDKMPELTRANIVVS